MTATANRQTLDQQRAAHAWAAVERAERELGDARAKKEFCNPAKKLGPRILTTGVGPAIQLLIAKKEAPKLVDELRAWLLEAGPIRTMQRSSAAQRNGGLDPLISYIVRAIRTACVR